MRLPMLALLLVPLLVASAQAGPFFPWRKADKVDPKTRVPELVAALKSDRDENKRSHAAVELRNYDPAQFPDIVPALVHALLVDSAQGVRIDAAQSLGKIRPVSQAAGEALEQSLEMDPSMRVRLQARSVLLGYQWAGYRSGKRPEIPPVVATPAPVVERRPGLSGLFLPPIRTTPSTIVTPMPMPMPMPSPGVVVPAPAPTRGTTAEPPLAAPDVPPASPPAPRPAGDGPILP